jgi:hypothetical protein
VSRKLKQGQKIYLWREIGNHNSEEREYRVTSVGPGWYNLNATDNGEHRLISDSHPDLDDKQLQVLEALDGLISK